MSNSVQTGLRLPRDQVERADRLISHVRRLSGGSTTRSGVLRVAIERGLSELEQEAGPATQEAAP